MDVTSSGSCVRMEKLTDGMFNKSFKLTMGNGRVVVARIPNPNVGPAFLTASEVATMDLLKNILSLPVPKVFTWNATVDSTNRVGTEYIIIEQAPGRNLADIWTDMDFEHKVQTMKDIVTIQQKLLSLKFSSYGCLFYRNHAPPGSHPVIVKGDELSHELENNIAERFSIGPVVGTEFWSNKRGDMAIDRGPWTSAIDYIQALALREIAWIQRYAIPLSPDDPYFVSHSQNDPAEHVSLLQRYLSVTPYLVPREEDILGSFLWHSDLRTPNIFVDDNCHITSLIGWQGKWACPLFLQDRYPNFLRYNGDLVFDYLENFKQLDENTQTIIYRKIIKSWLIYLYEVYIAHNNPFLYKVDRYSNVKPCPIFFVENTWDEEIIPLRESLIREWDTGQCPIYFSPEEIRKHYEDGDGWNEVQDFWNFLEGRIMDMDGWTSHGTYDQALALYSDLRAEIAAYKEREANCDNNCSSNS